MSFWGGGFPCNHNRSGIFFSFFALTENSTVYGKIGKQDCIPVGCVPPARCPYLPACTAPGGLLLGEGMCIPACNGADTPPPPVDRILDTRFWKYYLAATSLWAVNITFAPPPLRLPPPWSGKSCIHQWESSIYSRKETKLQWLNSSHWLSHHSLWCIIVCVIDSRVPYYRSSSSVWLTFVPIRASFINTISASLHKHKQGTFE